MSWSLGETAALALKAARGAGMSWGLAEETAASVVWLHTVSYTHLTLPTKA